MKRILLSLLLLPSLCFAAAFDFGIDQRSPANNSWEKRLLASPATPGVMVYDPATKLASWNTFGPGLSVGSGVISAPGVAPTWESVTGKPTFSPVAASGLYSDLAGRPTIPAAQVQSDWNASSGPSAIANKPVLFSGVYSDLSGKPNLFSGAYSDLNGIPSTFAPAPHTQAYSTITGTPTTVAGYGITDAVSAAGLSTTLSGYSTTASLASGLSTKFNTPTGNTSQYLRGDGTIASFPTIPAAQVQSDWNAASGPAAILNKPALFSGAYSALTGTPSTFAPAAHTQAWSTITATPTTVSGYGITDAATTGQLATKFNTPSGTAAQYVRGDGNLATLPVARRIETYTGTTNAQGQVIVVYPTAFAAAPVVQPPAPSAANQVWTTVSSTATGFTMQLNQRNSINLLNADVLLGATVPVVGTVAQFLVVAP